MFARSLGIAADPVDATNQLIDLLARGELRRIGLAHCDNRWFTFNAGLGWDAAVCEAVDAHRKNGRPATPAQYVRAAVRVFFRSKNAEPTLTVHVPGQERVEGVHYAFVSNASPWTYLNKREVHTNPDTNYDSGLGVFAMTSTSIVTTLRVARQLLTPASVRARRSSSGSTTCRRCTSRRPGRSDSKWTAITSACATTSSSCRCRRPWTWLRPNPEQTSRNRVFHLAGRAAMGYKGRRAS